MNIHSDAKGIILPYDGGVEILARTPPRPLETVNDQGGDIDALFKAAREAPLALAPLIEECDTPARCVSAARLVIDGGASGEENYGESVLRLAETQAFRYIGESAYGALLARLKTAQVENRPPVEIITAFAHQTNLILARPPAPLTERELAALVKALRFAPGERMLIYNAPPALMETAGALPLGGGVWQWNAT